MDVTLRAESRFDIARLKRHFFAGSSCGVCGKASISAVRLRGIRLAGDTFRLTPALLAGLPDVLLEPHANPAVIRQAALAGRRCRWHLAEVG